MNRPSVPIALLLFALPTTAAVFAAELAPAPGAAAPVAPPAVRESNAPRLPAGLMSPMVADLYTALDEQRAKMAKLRGDLARARGSSRELELQRALSAAKRETELRLLRIQADHARREGRLDVAGNLEAAITAMTAPAVPREPALRPAPSRDSDR